MTAAPSKKSLERRVRALEARVEMLESLLRALSQAAPRRPAGTARLAVQPAGVRPAPSTDGSAVPAAGVIIL